MPILFENAKARLKIFSDISTLQEKKKKKEPALVTLADSFNQLITAEKIICFENYLVLTDTYVEIILIFALVIIYN